MRFLAMVGFGLVLLLISDAESEAQVYIDREAASERLDFRLQGEYVGEVGPAHERRRLGAQVAVRGEGVSQALLYVGGLPGEGWDGSEPMALDATWRGGTAIFTWNDGSARLTESGLEVSGVEGGTVGLLNRIERRSPTLRKEPPQGAIVLFDGSERSLEHWMEGARIDDEGRLVEGATTRAEFGDFQLHLEYRVAFMPDATGQARANSGVYIQNRYEIQILDSFAEPPSLDGAGSLYRFRAADLNLSYPPLAWQTYDIDFRAPRFDSSGQKVANARVTVWHNGQLIHEQVELPRGTGAGGQRPEVARGPLHLQDHGNPIRFQNIWLVEGQ